MKAKILFVFILLSVCAAVAQSTDPSITGSDISKMPLRPNAVSRPGWNFGVWADYGNGVGTRSDVHIGGAGFRIGRVMTGEHGSRWARGTFELDADLTPVEIYHFPAQIASGYNVPVGAQNYYTGGITPFIAKWNFTRGTHWVPFVAAEGGVVFSTKDLPPGDTAPVNFTSGAAFGFHHFAQGKNAWTFQGKIYHLSNASIGPHNPGVNAAVQFKIGYTWFKFFSTDK